MSFRLSYFPRWAPAAYCFLAMAGLGIGLTAGCSEKPAAEAPADTEKARQDHINMMQRESGQAPAK